jgi:hypothetical protein
MKRTMRKQRTNSSAPWEHLICIVTISSRCLACGSACRRAFLVSAHRSLRRQHDPHSSHTITDTLLSATTLICTPLLFCANYFVSTKLLRGTVSACKFNEQSRNSNYSLLSTLKRGKGCRTLGSFGAFIGGRRK